MWRTGDPLVKQSLSGNLGSEDRIVVDVNIITARFWEQRWNFFKVGRNYFEKIK